MMAPKASPIAWAMVAMLTRLCTISASCAGSSLIVDFVAPWSPSLGSGELREGSLLPRARLAGVAPPFARRPLRLRPLSTASTSARDARRHDRHLHADAPDPSGAAVREALPVAGEAMDACAPRTSATSTSQSGAPLTGPMNGHPERHAEHEPGEQPGDQTGEKVASSRRRLGWRGRPCSPSAGRGPSPRARAMTTRRTSHQGPPRAAAMARPARTCVLTHMLREPTRRR